jgi:hypothetical protein
MKNHKGQIICDSSVVIDSKQKRIQIPAVINEILDIKKGDKFRWFIEKDDKGNLKIFCIYVGTDGCATYKYIKKKYK